MCVRGERERERIYGHPSKLSVSLFAVRQLPFFWMVGKLASDETRGEGRGRKKWEMRQAGRMGRDGTGWIDGWGKWRGQES